MPSPRKKLRPVTREAEAFYAESLRVLKDSGIPFVLAGTFAIMAYTGINRHTKDLDIFCKPGDYARILALFDKLGYRTDVKDARWLAKVHQDEHFFDVIFGSTAAVVTITDPWFEQPRLIALYGTEVQLAPPTELLWSKAFLMDRNRYDGADIAHLILKQHEQIDWRRLLSYMDQHWDVLLMHVINFRFIYPSERELIPRWLFDELVARLGEHADLPVSRLKVCRGRLFSGSDYLVDVTEWGFGDVVGDAEGRYGRS